MGTGGRILPRRAARKVSMTDFFNYLILGLTRGSMYALIALGYTLVYGVLQLINFAHSEVFMCGAFGGFLVIFAIIGNVTSVSPWAVPLLIVLGLAVGAATSGGVA